MAMNPSSYLLFGSSMFFCLRMILGTRGAIDRLLSLSFMVIAVLIPLQFRHSYNFNTIILVGGTILCSISIGWGAWSPPNWNGAKIDLYSALSWVGIFEVLTSNDLIKIWIGAELFFSAEAFLILAINKWSGSSFDYLSKWVNYCSTAASVCSWIGACVMYDLISGWEIDSKAIKVIQSIDPNPIWFSYGLILFVLGIIIRPFLLIPLIFQVRELQHSPMSIIFATFCASSTFFLRHILDVFFNHDFMCPIAVYCLKIISTIFFLMVAGLLFSMLWMGKTIKNKSFIAIVMDALICCIAILNCNLSDGTMLVLFASMLSLGVANITSHRRCSAIAVQFNKWRILSIFTEDLAKIVVPVTKMGLPPSAVFAMRMYITYCCFMASTWIGILSLVCFMTLTRLLIKESYFDLDEECKLPPSYIPSFELIQQFCCTIFILISWAVASTSIFEYLKSQ